MELNADRLAKLAGLSVTKRTSLNEASNRSQHEEPGHDPEFRHGKGQLAEGEDEKDVEEAHCTEAEEEQEEGMVYEADDARDTDDPDLDEYGSPMMDGEDADDLVEIDEAMLAEEIAKMRQERLQENELRSIIRNEVASIVNQMKKSTTDRSKAKPRETNGIAKGFAGPGFM